MPKYSTPQEVLLYDSGEISGAAATFDVQNISAAFVDLYCMLMARGDNASTSVTVNVTVNNDTGTNYDRQLLRGSAATASASESLGSANINPGTIPAASAPAGVAGSMTIEIPSYSGSTFQKSLIFLNAEKLGTSTGNLQANFFVGFWRSTAAITRITLTPSAGNFAAGSRFRIYGRK